LAFNAGSIEATLTLNRNPFTAGLAAARNQARNFAKEKYEATAKIKVDDASFTAAKRQFDNFAKQSRQALARVLVDRLGFDALVRDLRAFGRQTYTATARVNTSNSTSQLNGLINNIRRSADAADHASGRFGEMGNNGEKAFSHMRGGMRALLATLPLLLPVAGSAITGVIGLVGALTAAVVGAGVGVGAFALVAVPLFKQVKDAVAAGQGEIDKLPGSLKNAGNALKGLTDQVKVLSDAARQGVGFAFTAAFNAATAAIKPLLPLINSVSAAIVLIGKSAQEYFKTSHYTDFIGMLSKNMVPLLTTMFEIIAYGTRAVMNLTTAFMPMAQWLLRAMADGMKDFAKWTGTLASDPRFHQWVETAKEALRRMWEFLVSATKFLFEFAYAMAPLGSAIFNVLAIIFNGLSKLPPEWLNGIAIGLAAIFTAMMIGATGPVALAIGAIVGVATALTTLYDSNEKVRQSIDAFVKDLKAGFLPIWETIRDNFENKIVPAWNSLADAYNRNLKPVLEDLWAKAQEKLIPALGSLVDTLTSRVIPAFLGFLEAVAPFAAWLTGVFGTVLIEELQAALRVVDGILISLSGLFLAATGLITGDWEKFGAGLNTISEGFWTVVAATFGMNLEELKTQFKTWDTEMQDSWKKFWEGTKQNTDDGTGETRTKFRVFLDDTKTAWDADLKLWEERWTAFWDYVIGDTSIKGRDNEKEMQDFLARVKSDWDADLQLWTDRWNKFWVDINTGSISGGGVTQQQMGTWGDQITADWNADLQLWTDRWNQFWTDNNFGTLQGTTTGRTTIQTWLAGVGTDWNADLEIWKTRWTDFWTWVDQNTVTGTWNVGGKINTWLTEQGATWNADLELWKGYWASFWEWFGPKTDEGTTTNGEKIRAWLAQVGADWNADLELWKTRWNDFWGAVGVAAEGGMNDTGARIRAWLASQGAAWSADLKIWEDRWNGFWNALIAGINSSGERLRARWEQLMHSLAAPVDWVINNVFNRLIGAWNNVMSFIGGSQAGYIPGTGARTGGSGLPASGTGRPRPLAAGGPVFGGIPNKDSVRALLMPGEFVLSKRMVRGLGGMDSVMAMGQMARTQAFAAGGSVGAPAPAAAPVSQNVSWWSQIGDWVTGLFRGISTGPVPGAGGQIGSGLQSAGTNAVNRALQAAFNKLSSMFTTIWSVAGQVITNPMGVIGKAIGGAEGGAVSKGGFYDDGGFLPPIAPFNGTGKPEPVLTNNQWDAVQDDTAILRKLDELIEVLDRKKLDVTVNVDKDGKATTHGDKLALRLGRR
jgi:hypothetical protein